MKLRKCKIKEWDTRKFSNLGETIDVETIREELAEFAHRQWSGWMKYLFDKCIRCTGRWNFNIKEKAMLICEKCGKQVKYLDKRICQICEEENSNVPKADSRYNVLADVGERLLPCPFCGIPAAIGSLGGDKENWAIWCVACGMACAETGLNGDTKKDIIESWNKRANVS